MMRNEVLHGYLIHHRKYREKSHIVHLYTQEYGRVDGIIRQIPPPQYQPIRLQASGKSELKNFTKLEILNQPVFFHGDAFFAGFYLNEILLRLCPLEEAMLRTFEQYQLTLLQLQQLASHESAALFLRQILRQFEHVLLQEILPLQHYQFQLNDGFIPVAQASRSTIPGSLIATMQSYQDEQDFSHEQLRLLGKLYRQMISSLLGDRPLKSRQLWIQNTQT